MLEELADRLKAKHPDRSVFVEYHVRRYRHNADHYSGYDVSFVPGLDDVPCSHWTFDTEHELREFVDTITREPDSVTVDVNPFSDLQVV